MQRTICEQDPTSDWATDPALLAQVRAQIAEREAKEQAKRDLKEAKKRAKEKAAEEKKAQKDLEKIIAGAAKSTGSLSHRTDSSGSLTRTKTSFFRGLRKKDDVSSIKSYESN